MAHVGGDLLTCDTRELLTRTDNQSMIDVGMRRSCEGIWHMLDVERVGL
jgi:hypothetical protein